MILYVLKQNKNSKSAAFGKYFAYPVIEETVNLDALAEHMSSHNTLSSPFSEQMALWWNLGATKPRCMLKIRVAIMHIND